jgi:hypothetical protein
MNHIKSNFYLCLLVTGLLLWSCSKDSENPPPPELFEISEPGNALDADNKLLKDISLLVGIALGDAEVRAEVNSKIETADALQELASLSLLLGQENGLSKKESNAMKTGKLSVVSGTNRFAEALVREVATNIDAYTSLSAHLDRNGINPVASKSTEGLSRQLTALLAGQNLEIYYPFEDKSDVSAKTDAVFFVTYRPVQYVEENEVFQYNGADVEAAALKSFGVVNNDFIETNDVYVLGQLDECDLPNANCDYEDLVPVEPEGQPEPIAARAKLLTYNVNHSSIEEKDIVSTRFAGFKIDGNDWLGFGASHQKLDIYRGSADGKITIDEGKISATSKSYNISYYRIRAKGARKGWWYHHNDEFDDDWNMSENEQVITLFTKHHLTGSASVELNTKAGLELKDGSIKAVPQATVSSKVKVSVGSARQRTKAQLSRRQVLSTIVGPGVTQRTITRDGTTWNVKKSGIFHYYFKHYHTDL